MKLPHTWTTPKDLHVFDPNEVEWKEYKKEEDGKTAQETEKAALERALERTMKAIRFLGVERALAAKVLFRVKAELEFYQ